MAGPGALAALVLASFWPLVFGSGYTFLDYGDLVFEVLPWWQVQARAWHAGIFPLWDPYVWCGQSLLGQVQPGGAFPFNWPLFLAPLDENGFLNLRWVHWHFAAMHVLAGLAAYAWVRSRGASRMAAVFAGLAFATTGFVGTIWWPQLMNGAIWIPLTFLLARRTATSSKSRSWAWAVLCGGTVGLSFLSGHHQAPLHGAIALASYVCYLAARRWRISGTAAVGLLSRFAATAVAASLVAGLAVLPALEYGHRAYRWVGLDHPVRFDEAVPREIHQTWSFSIGDYLHSVVPVEGFENSPFLGWAALSLAVAAIVALRRTRETSYFAALAVIAALYTLGPETPIHQIIYSFVPLADKARNSAHAVYVAQFAVITLAAAGVDSLFRPAKRRVLAAMVAAAALALFLAPGDTPYRTASQIAALAVCLALVSARTRPRLAQFALLGVLFFEGNCGRLTRIYPVAEAPVLAKLADFGGALDFLERQPQPFRFVIRATDKPNLGAWRGLEDTSGYLASINIDLYDFFGRDWRGAELTMNTIYEIAREPFDERQQRVFRGPDGWNVYRNPNARPRVWFEDAPQDCRAAASYERIHLQRVEIRASLACPASLIVADPYFPGWQARVDGAASVIRPFQGALMALDLSPGSHEIELTYQPASVVWGGAMSALGFAACLLAAGALFRGRRGR